MECKKLGVVNGRLGRCGLDGSLVTPSVCKRYCSYYRKLDEIRMMLDEELLWYLIGEGRPPLEHWEREEMMEEWNSRVAKNGGHEILV